MDNARAAERFFWLLSFATWQTLLNNFTIEGYFRKIADPRDIASTAGAWKHASPAKTGSRERSASGHHRVQCGHLHPGP
ncbi:MAG: hypothetical protein WBM67_13325, partial [Sedimenticolaceae bacterium]